MSHDQASVNFDRAAGFYDATRDVGATATGRTLDIVAAGVGGRGRVLEIGVGTGALAIPLVGRGIDVVGIDLSSAMLAKLVEKAGTQGSPRVLRADATRLPFPDGAFGAAYGRHVLHLMADWRTAVAELCRVVGRGVILIDAGGGADRWFDLWLEMRTVLGPEADHVGLDMGREGDETLDAAFLAAGAAQGPVSTFTYPELETVADVLEEIARRSPSWTWRVPDDQLRRAIEVARAWTLERYGTLDLPLEEESSVRWRTYLVGGSG